MKKHILLITVFIFSAFIFVSSALGQNDQRPGKGDQQSGFKKLNLTDAQKDKIEGLRIDHQKRMVDLNSALKETRDCFARSFL